MSEDLSYYSQSSRSNIRSTTTRKIFLLSNIVASIRTIDFPLPVGKTTSKSFSPCIAYITAIHCSSDAQSWIKL